MTYGTFKVFKKRDAMKHQEGERGGDHGKKT
jgi:hypothetical protein